MGKRTTISRTATVKASPAQVLELVATTAGFTSINPHRTADPKLEITPFGPAKGIGSGFAFRGKDGKGTQRIVAVNSESVQYAIDMGSRGRSEQRIRAVPAGDGARVEWSMTLDAGWNPMLLIFGLFADKVLGPVLQTGVGNLGAACR